MTPTSVLLMEDEPATQKQVEGMLVNLGCKVRCPESGRKGLSLFGTGAYDLVLSSADLTEEDGIEVVGRMKEMDPTLAAILMAEQRDAETMLRATEQGIVSFLIKPFDQQELKKRLERELNDRRERMEIRLLMGDLLRIRADLAGKVQEQERFLQHLIDAAPFAIVSTNPDGRIITFNRTAERLYGYQLREVIGSPIGMLTVNAAEMAPPFRGPLKARHCHKDGGTFPALIQRTDIFGDTGLLMAKLFVVEDLTEREQMEVQLAYAEKMSLLGQLAPRIAHEIKTPLQIVTGHTELGLMLLRDGKVADARKSLEHIGPAVARMLLLVRQMLELGKPEQACYRNLDLQTELESALTSLEGLGAVKHCMVVRQFAESIPPVQGDPAQIEQVFRNLIINAAQAMEECPRKVLTFSVQPDPGNHSVIVTIADTGHGIATENAERVFQPFFTTKVEGTGLGLPIVRSIVERHGGRIEVDSKEEVGTTITLSFPAAVYAVALEQDALYDRGQLQLGTGANLHSDHESLAIPSQEGDHENPDCRR